MAFRAQDTSTQPIRSVRIISMSVATISPTVWQHALDLFGSEQKAARWMATRLSELQERTPEEVINETPDAVEAILDRIEYGVFS
jgi:putative toxin-antitoxin system antitoxin component (TIGR02293 family)